MVEKIIEKVKSNFAADGETLRIANRAYEMGVEYAATKRFDNSRHYHNYQFRLDDGARVMSSSFFNIFMSRSQTPAYMEAEKVLRELIEDEKKRELIFRMVRDKRQGINGAFKAIMSPVEPQQLNMVDYILVIACFCAGAIGE